MTMICNSETTALLARTLCAILLTAGVLSPSKADLPATLGGGNIIGNLSKADVKFKALNGVGVGMCRIPVSPGDYGLETA